MTVPIEEFTTFTFEDSVTNPKNYHDYFQYKIRYGILKEMWWVTIDSNTTKHILCDMLREGIVKIVNVDITDYLLSLTEVGKEYVEMLKKL